MSENIIGLGLESSCDETAAAIIENGKKICSNIISSQIETHKEYNGVVPEIASRAHLETINSLIHKSFEEAGVSFSDINYVAVTHKPGLIGSLLIALQSAKAISYVKGIPLIGINHLEAHLYAPFLEKNNIAFPYIGLLISGGNTALYIVKGIGKMELLGKTVDDAVGEAYDKVSKFLNLGYPGGPVIESLANKATIKKLRFPKILADSHDYRFSYSGIKTAVINYIKQNPEADVHEIAYAFQERALEVLTRKVFQASRSYNINRIVIAGGVAANGRLRVLFERKKKDNEEVIIPSPILCTDNAAMIGGLGYHYYKRKSFHDFSLDVYPKIS